MATRGQTGSKVQPNLIKQLETRQAAFKSSNKSRDQQLYINSNTAWVKLRSSVNVVTDEEMKNLDEAIGSKDVSYELKHDPAIAETNVLMAGLRSTSKNSPYGRESAGISRDGNAIDSNAAYQNFSGINSLGFRPMPGITGLSIKSKGTYGVTMQAEVSIKVHSVEDLEAIELLYFRPGYTALLEWGHSVYLDNDGNLIQNSTTGLTDTEWFTKSDEKDINDSINKKRDSTDGNYDAMYAYITNFSFTYLSDGSYDCTIKLLSKGVILEGLQPSKTSDFNNDSEEDKEDKEDHEKSSYHFLHKFIEEGSKTGELLLEEHLKRNPKKTSILSNQIKHSGHFIFSEENPEGIYEPINDIPVYSMEMEMDVGNLFDKNFNLHFIHLGDFLRILNSINTLNDPRKTNKDRAKEYIFDVSPGNKYTTHPDHFSCDPIVAYPTLKPQGKNGSDETVAFAWRAGALKENDVLKDCAAFYRDIDIHEMWSNNVKKFPEKYGTPDDVLSIPISFYSIIKEIDSLIEGNNEGISMFDIITNLLSKVSDALGDIVELDLFYNYDLEKYQVIDRKNRVPDSLPYISLTGLSTTAKNISVSSTISSNIATQISIAAQSNTGNSKDSLAVMMEWNRGAVDRHKPVKLYSLAKTDEEQDEKNKKFIKNLYKLYSQFQNRGLWRDHIYNLDLVSSIKREAHVRNSQLLSIHRLNQTKPKPPTGVVPVELSFDILGMYGFVIGTTFKVNKGFLPPRYDNFAYLITGIENKIDNNQWITSIKTQFYPDRGPKQVIPKKSAQSRTTITEQQRERLANGIPATAEQMLNDPAPVINPSKVGATGYSHSPLRNKVINSIGRPGYAAGRVGKYITNGNLDILDPSELVYIGETINANKEYTNPATGIPEYMLAPEAAQAWFKWRDEMRATGIAYRVSSAYRSSNHQNGISGGRTVAKPGRSPHGIGGALDFGNLYQLVNGSGDPNVNLEQGRLNPAYKQIAEIGAKYNWYNPWRLSDFVGIAECWHFEYWGPVAGGYASVHKSNT